jgi:hypothetical protein
MVRICLLGLLLTTLLSSCFKEDTRMAPYPGTVTLIPDSVQVYQSYFDFETGKVVRTIPNNSWQLGFECGANGWHIITNSGSNWFIYNTKQTVPDAVTQIPPGLYHLYDVPHAFPDSTAVGDWVDGAAMNSYSHNIYLLGHFTGGKFTQIKQIEFYQVSATGYRFWYKEQVGGSADSINIVKDESVNFVYFNFSSHKQTDVEPSRDTWDLVFLPYFDLATLFGTTIPYNVGGAFINTSHTEAVLDSVNNFFAIDSAMIPNYHFTAQRDIPGYRWKSPIVDISSGSANYLIKSNYNYIFHTTGNNFYVLKFLSYSRGGSNGHPQFEFRKL